MALQLLLGHEGAPAPGLRRCRNLGEVGERDGVVCILLLLLLLLARVLEALYEVSEKGPRKRAAGSACHRSAEARRAPRDTARHSEAPRAPWRHRA